MRRRTLLPIVATLAATLVFSASAAERDPDRQIEPRSPWRTEEPRPEPRPGPPAPAQPAAAVGEGFQLVGFTQELFRGNTGVLNLTRACQQAFPASRVCGVGEILRTVNVPDSPGSGHTWVLPCQDSVGPTGMATVSAVAQRLRPAPDDPGGMDCDGWMSDSPRARGLTISLDPDCYGGFVTRACDEALAVACCAVTPVE